MQQDIEYLVDRPSDEDHFGTHTRLANSIADVISTHHQISAIGLLGSWGSGKSTVVRKVNELLAGDPSSEKVHTYTYDAWLHQSDPPRRAFLEELIEDLVDHSLLEGDRWEARMAELSGRSETTETKTSRGLTTSGKLIFASLSLLPLGLALFDFGLQRTFGTSQDSNGSWFLIIAIFLLVLPLLVGFGIFVAWRPWSAFKRKENEEVPAWIWRGLVFLLWKFWTQKTESGRQGSVFDLLANRSSERSTNTTKISPDPTAIEFRHIFSDLLKAVSASGKRLVITIDNLDRLTESDAMNLWATIRSLFLFKDEQRTENNDVAAPIVILPIDETAIERMFKVQHPDEASDLAAAFIDKTFDITFIVTEPVMSDWREYLRQKMEEAFGSEEIDSRVYWTTAFLERKIHSNPERITPRKIIRLINSIASLWHQNRELGIGFVATAFFTVNRRELGENLQKELGRAELVLDGMVQDWRRQIIALHYGVHPDKAIQVYLSERLKQALQSGDKNGFKESMEVEGAWPVLEDVANSLPSAGAKTGYDGDYLVNLCSFSADLDHRDDIRFSGIVRVLSKAWVEGVALQTLRTETASALQEIWNAKTESSSDILSATSKAFAEAIGRLDFTDQTRPQITQCVALYSELAAQHEGQSEKIHLSLDTQAALRMVYGVEPKVLQFIQFELNAAEFSGELNTALNDKNRSSMVSTAISKLQNLSAGLFQDQNPVSFDQVEATAFQLLQSQAYNFHAAKPSLELLGQLYGQHKPARNHTVELCNNGRLNSFIQDASQAADWAGVEQIAALMLLRRGEVAPLGRAKWEQVIGDQKDFAQGLWTRLRRYLNDDRAEFLLEARNFAPSFAPVLDELLRHEVREEECSNLTATDVIKHIETVQKALDQDTYELCLISVSAEDEFWKSLESIEALPAFLSAANLIGKAEGIARNKLGAAIYQRLGQAEASDWNSAINEGGPIYDLVKLYQDVSDKPKLLGESLKNTLKDNFPSPLSLELEARKRWFSLSTLISKSIRATLYRNLRDSVLGGAQVEQLSGLLEAGGMQLLEEGDFAKLSDGCARHLLLPLLKTPEGQGAIHSLSEFFSSIIPNVEEDTLATVRDTIEGLAEENDEAARQLTSALGLS